MKVALYYPWIYLTSGAERTILELTGRSRHEWTIFTNRFEPESTFTGFAEREVVALEAVSVRRALLPVAAAGTRILRQRLPLEGFDALVVVCEGLGDLVLARNRGVPAICVCLTPLRIAFDPVYRARYLERVGPTRRAVIGTGAAAFRWLDRLLWRRYQHVLCISEECRKRVRAGGLAPDDRLELAHVGLGFSVQPSERFDRFFLLPGRIMWTKNIELGLQAFEAFRGSPEGRDFRLVVAGIVDEKSRPYLARLREIAGKRSGVEFRVFPSDEQLAELYRSCYGVLFTAFNEDWGIVPLESMAFGKPVVATNRGGPTESIEDGVQGFLEEPEPGAFARRMRELVRDESLARSMGRAGASRARGFTWEGFADRVDRAVAAAASAPAEDEPTDGSVDAGAPPRL